MILHNAARLADSELTCPVIAADNRGAADEVADLLSTQHKVPLCSTSTR